MERSINAICLHFAGRGRATIPAFHSVQVLPKHLTAFFISLLNLRECFDSKAEQRAVKTTKPKSGFESCRVEIYPKLPEHTIENEYICCTAVTGMHGSPLFTM